MANRGAGAGAFLLLVLAALVVAGTAAAAEPAAVVPNPLLPPTTGGLESIDRNLAKLETHARLLVIGAHPDDEDTSLLALVARGMAGEAAYLSLSRGEGGQNLIGAEQGLALGLLRTQELLAARRLDGARQFFTRAFDFGYTASLAETLERWPKAVLVEDTVRVIRRFRPQVVVSIFPNDGGGGHGQHQAAGVAAHEAFRAAADPAALPGLRAEGLSPWTPLALYRATWFDRAQTTLVLATGGVEPFSGRSIHQLAMASRSQHRSQDMGRLQEVGPKETRLGWVSGGAGVGGALLFAGIDTRLRSIALELPEGAAREALWASLERVEEVARTTRARLAASGATAGAGAAAAGARDALARLRAARAQVTSSAALDFLEEKIGAAEAAWIAARGIVVDATVERETVAPGEEIAVLVSLWNTSHESIRVTGAGLNSAEGWQGGGPASPPFTAQDLLPGRLLQWTLRGRAPGDGPAASVPYFLRRPLRGDVYDWSAAPAGVWGSPFEPPPLSARFSLEDDGAPLAVSRAVVFRRNDQAAGEIRRPLRAAPAVEVVLVPDMIVVAAGAGGAGGAGGRDRSLEVVLTSHSERALSGRLVWEMPPGWPTPTAARFALAPRGGDVLAARIAPPQAGAAGRFPIRVRALLDDGATSAMGLSLVDHPHVPPTPYPRDAETRVVVADLRFAADRRVAYVPGAGDRVAEALRGAGLALDTLAGADLRRRTAAELRTSYDTIVIGSRAYETEPALAAANARLREFVEAGGVLIVLYQQYPFIEGGFAPRPLSIARPHDRVTDEKAPVTLLVPAHPVFQTPNRIGAEDWNGWVQERGLYLAHDWDPIYQPLIELPGPAGEPLRGALLAARIGRGAYVYTGLAFFRQLPAGVPGAYRLFANLLALDPAAL